MRYKTKSAHELKSLQQEIDSVSDTIMFERDELSSEDLQSLFEKHKHLTSEHDNKRRKHVNRVNRYQKRIQIYVKKMALIQKRYPVILTLPGEYKYFPIRIGEKDAPNPYLRLPGTDSRSGHLIGFYVNRSIESAPDFLCFVFYYNTDKLNLSYDTRKKRFDDSYYLPTLRYHMTEKRWSDEDLNRIYGLNFNCIISDH